MTDSDIFAVAESDAPEVLEADALDQVTAGTTYGGTNTCEPPRRNGRLDGLFIKSWGTSGVADETGGFMTR